MVCLTCGLSLEKKIKVCMAINRDTAIPTLCQLLYPFSTHSKLVEPANKDDF